MGFSLIEDDTFWKREEVSTGGAYDRGVWIEGTVVVTYPTILGLADPYSQGKENFDLPVGVGSNDAYILFTAEDLLVHTSLPEESNMADILYLEDPDVRETTGYLVYAKMHWKNNTGFNLVENSFEYLLVRKDLV